MSEMNLKLRLSGDGKQLTGVIETATGEVRKFSTNLEGGADKGTAALKRTEQQTQKLSNSTGSLAGKVVAAAAAYVSIQTAARMLREVTGATLEQERVQAQLEARVKSTGMAAGRSVEQLLANAGALQRVTTFGNEQIASMQGVLLTFTQIAGTQFDRATESIINMSTVLGSDLQSSALQAGKALNDPVAGISALSKAGITFSPIQQQLIRDLVKTGQVAAAQGVILDELDNKFGRAARAARETLGGSLQAARNAFGDLLEFRGDLPALADEVEGLVERLADPALAESIQAGLGAGLAVIPPILEATITVMTKLLQTGALVAENGDKIAVVAVALSGVMAGRLAPSVLAVVAAKRLAIVEAVRYNLALASMAGITGRAAAGQLALAAASRAARGALFLLGGPVGVAVAGTAALVISARNSRKEIEQAVIPTQNFSAALERMGEALQFDDAENGLKVVREQLTIVREEAERVADALDRAQNLRTRGGQGGRDGIIIRNESTDVENALAKRLEAINEQVRLAEQLSGEASYEDLTNLINGLGVAAELAEPLLVRLGLSSKTAADDGVATLADGITKLLGPLDSQIEKLREQLTVLRDGEAALIDQREALALVAAAEEDAAAGTTANTEAVRARFAELRQLTAALEAEETAQRDAEDAASDQLKTLEDLVGVYSDLRDEIDPLAARQEELTTQLGLMTDAARLGEGQLRELGIDSRTLESIIEALVEQLDDLGQVDLSQADSVLASIEAQIAAIDGGPDALAAYQRELFITQQLEAAGIPIAQQYAEAYRQQAAAIRAASGALFDRQNAPEPSADPFGLGQLGGNVTTALLNGQDLGGSLGQSLIAFGQEPITDAINDVFSNAMAGLGDSPGVKAGIEIGALAIGQALQGNLTQAITTVAGAAIGAAIGGPVGGQIGGAIGSLIGELIGREGKPKFQLSGINTRGSADLGSRDQEAVDTRLGELFLGLRGIEAEAADQLRNSLQQFAAGIAAVVRDDDLLELIESQLANTAFSSRSDGNSIERFLASVFDNVVSALPGAVAEFVRRGLTTEEQLQRFADAFAVERELFLRNGLGLSGSTAAASPIVPITPPGGGIGPVQPGPPRDDFSQAPRSIGDMVIAAITGPLDGQVGPVTAEIAEFQAVLAGAGDAAALTHPELLATLEMLEAHQIGAESLAETYQRLVGVTQLMDTAFALTSNNFDGTREQMIEWSADLLAIFGDDLDRLTALTDAAFGRFFSDDQRLLQQADAARDRAIQLLGDLGISATDAVLTQAGFGELFNSLFGALGPESTALLLEAAAAVDAMLTAEETLAETRQSNAEELADVMRAIDDAIGEMTGASPLVRDFRDLRTSSADLRAEIIALDGAQSDLTQEQRLYQLQLQALTAAVRASLADIAAQINGTAAGGLNNTSSQINQIGQLNQAIDNRYEREQQAIARISDMVDSLLVGNLSPLDPTQQVNEARNQLLEALIAAEGGDTDAMEDVPQLLQQFLSIFQGFTGGVGEYPAEFQALIDRALGIESQATPSNGPPTSSQVGSIQQSVSGMALSQLDLVQLTARYIEELGLLNALTGDLPAQMAEEYGVPLRQAVETLIGDLDNITDSTVEGLVEIADTLGITVGDLATAIDVQIGALRDQDSLLNDALENAIAGLPPELQEALLAPLRALELSTTDEAANAALDALVASGLDLPIELRNQLAPFFEGIDTVDLETAQVGLLETIRDIDQRTANAAETTAQLLARVASNLQASNTAAGIPSFAAGGWVNRETILRAGEAGREMILPNPVSEFFASQGVPINAPTSAAASTAVVEEIRGMRQDIRAGNAQREEQSRIIQVGNSSISSAIESAQAERERLNFVGADSRGGGNCGG